MNLRLSAIKLQLWRTNVGQPISLRLLTRMIAVTIPFAALRVVATVFESTLLLTATPPNSQSVTGQITFSLFGVVMLVIAWASARRGLLYMTATLLLALYLPSIFVIALVLPGELLLPLSALLQITALLLLYVSRRTLAAIVLVGFGVLLAGLLLSPHVSDSVVPAATSIFMSAVYVLMSVPAFVSLLLVHETLVGQKYQLAQAVASLDSAKTDLEAKVRRRTESLSRQNVALQTIQDMAGSISNRTGLEAIFRDMLRRVALILGTPHAFVDLFDEQSGLSRCVAWSGDWSDRDDRAQAKGEGIVGRVWATGEVVLVRDYNTWEHRLTGLGLADIGPALGIPLIVEGQTIGVLCASRPVGAAAYTSEDVARMTQLGRVAAIAIDNARLYDASRASELELERRVDERTTALTIALSENEKLRERAVIAAAQSERSRLARELHDSVSQAVFGISLGVRTLLDLGARNNPVYAGPLDYIHNLSGMALAEMRALIFELRPESLQEEGLLAALDRQAAAVQARYQLVIDTEGMCHEPEAELAVKEALYRIALEAIHNTVKHAGATRVRLSLKIVDSDIHMQVADNGRGFDATGKFPGHLGLVSMRERVDKLGGTVSIESVIGQGTTVSVCVPAFAEVVPVR
jgi:signal transduction histidine kinase